MKSSLDSVATKKRVWILLACGISGLWMFVGPGCGAHEITLRVVDDKGEPVSGAKTVVSFNYRDSVVRRGKTNRDGIVRAIGTIDPAAFVRVTKNGYYDYVIRGVKPDESHDLVILLRERRNAIPLVAYDVRLSIPEEGREIGFDLKVGDWVSPFGKGEISDLTVEFARKFKDFVYSGSEWEKIKTVNRDRSEEELKGTYGNWDARLKISVPGEHGGFFVDTEGFIPESDLSMPHMAPEEGYENSVTMRVNSPPSSAVYPPFKTGMFVRTRVETNEDTVTRAHYTKILGGIEFLPGRSVADFVYYFNPRENDRNLEFDPKQNLAKDQWRSFPP